MVEGEVVAKLVGEGLALVARRLQLSLCSRDIVENDNAIPAIARRSKVCVPLRPPLGVVAVDFGDDVDVDVLVGIPAPHRTLEGEVVKPVKRRRRGHPVRHIVGPCARVVPRYARGRVVLRIALGQAPIYLGVDVSFSEVFVCRLHGGEHLGVCDVFFSSGVDDVEHEGQGFDPLIFQGGQSPLYPHPFWRLQYVALLRR